MELWFLFGIVVTLIHLKLSLSLFLFFVFSRRGVVGCVIKSSTCWCLNWREGVEEKEGREKEGGAGEEDGGVWYSALCPRHKNVLVSLSLTCTNTLTL